MAERTDDVRVLDLLGEATARAILTAAYPEPASARAIAEDLDVAPSTVYRHVDRLVAADLLVERTKIERDGSHHGLYETNLDQVRIDLDGEGFVVTVTVSRPPAEQFAKIWTDMRRRE